ASGEPVQKLIPICHQYSSQPDCARRRRMQLQKAYHSQCPAVPPRPAPDGARRPAAGYCLLLLALLTVTTGCMTSFREYIDNGFKVGPNYKKPAAPVSENWIDYQDTRVIS